jgi:hypothetical protein
MKLKLPNIDWRMSSPPHSSRTATWRTPGTSETAISIASAVHVERGARSTSSR